jgi:hypothetical protein
MSWQSLWINPHNEATFKSMTLLLTSPIGKTYRIDKVFEPTQQIDEDFLSSVVEKEIKNIELEQSQENR